MGGDTSIGRLTFGIQFDWLSMTSVNPTIEVLVQVESGQLSVFGMGDVAAKDPGHPWIALQWGDQIHQPHAICWDGVLRDESDVLPSRQLHAQVAGAPMAEIFLANSVQTESLVLWKHFDAPIAGGAINQQHFKGLIEIL